MSKEKTAVGCHAIEEPPEDASRCQQAGANYQAAGSDLDGSRLPAAVFVAGVESDGGKGLKTRVTEPRSCWQQNEHPKMQSSVGSAGLHRSPLHAGIYHHDRKCLC